MCTCVSRVSECVCAYVRVQSAFVFRVPGMMGVKASKQSLYIERGAQQRLLGEKPVRDAGKLQSSPQSSVPCAPEHLSIDHYWHLQGDGSHSSPLLLRSTEKENFTANVKGWHFCSSSSLKQCYSRGEWGR